MNVFEMHSFFPQIFNKHLYNAVTYSELIIFFYATLPDITQDEGGVFEMQCFVG